MDEDGESGGGGGAKSDLGLVGVYIILVGTCGNRVLMCVYKSNFEVTLRHASGRNSSPIK